MTFQETAAGGTIGTSSPADYPEGATPVHNSSGNVANANAIATLPAAAGKTTYIAGFIVSGSGATVALAVVVTVAGLTGGTATFIYGFVAGVILPNSPLIVVFGKPIPANAPNTAITVTCPPGGLGAVNNAVVAYGYQL